MDTAQPVVADWHQRDRRVSSRRDYEPRWVEMGSPVTLG